MGISLSLVCASDQDLRRFQQRPADADARLAGLSGFDAQRCCHLNDRWAALHFLLTGDPDASGPPLGWLKAGEVTIPGASDPPWGLYADTVRRFAAALAAVSEDALVARFDATDLRAAGPKRRLIYPGRWGPPGSDPLLRQELLTCFRTFRAFVSRAAAEDSGLLLCRYEDW